MTQKQWSRLAITSVLGVITSLFGVLSALFIRNVRLVFGRKIFLISTVTCASLLAGFGLWELSLQYSCICLLIGLYREMEELKLSIFMASCVAVMMTAGGGLFAFISYAQVMGYQLQTLTKEGLSPLLTMIQQIPQFQAATMSQLLWHMPALIVVGLTSIIFVSISISLSPLSQSDRSKLQMFKLPDWMIWTFIGSLAGSFLIPSPEWFGLVMRNFLIVSVASFFYQGLAVMTYFLNRYKIYGLWRWILYPIVFLQAFASLSVIILGLLDYWFEFRTQNLIETNKTTKDLI